MARPTLTTHRKFRRLAQRLGSAIVARGVLELLWEACYESGDEYIGTADDLENLLGWTGERGFLALALVDAGLPEGHGFIEPLPPAEGSTAMRYQVHDLWHHAPDYVTKRRQRELDRRQKSAPNSPRRRSADFGGHCPPSSDCLPGLDRTPAPAPAPAQKNQTASADDVVDLWNQLVTAPIPKVTRLTADRKRKIDARLKVYPDLADWRTAIVWVNGQSWCRAPGNGDHPNWTATIDWLCRSDEPIQRALERAATVMAKVVPIGQADTAKRNYGSMEFGK
jgi:hypothetical protein